MSIKVEVLQTVKEPNKIKYPVLMEGINTGRIVLFYRENTGIILKGENQGLPLCTALPCTDTAVWKKFKGTITLCNE